MARSTFIERLPIYLKPKSISAPRRLRPVSSWGPTWGALDLTVPAAALLQGSAAVRPCPSPGSPAVTGKALPACSADAGKNDCAFTIIVDINYATFSSKTDLQAKVQRVIWRDVVLN